MRSCPLSVTFSSLSALSSIHYLSSLHILYCSQPYCNPYYSFLLYSTQPYSTQLYSTQLYSTLLYSTVFCSALLNSTLLYSTFHCTNPHRITKGHKMSDLPLEPQLAKMLLISPEYNCSNEVSTAKSIRTSSMIRMGRNTEWDDDI